MTDKKTQKKKPRSLVRRLIVLSLLVVLSYGCVKGLGALSDVTVQQEKNRIAALPPEERIKEERKLEIEKQFSAWSGAHRNLEEYIIENMNDPDSYEHVDTKYFDKGTYLIVITEFRGKNAFGGTVASVIKAEIGLNGKIWSIVD